MKRELLSTPPTGGTYDGIDRIYDWVHAPRRMDWPKLIEEYRNAPMPPATEIEFSQLIEDSALEWFRVGSFTIRPRRKIFRKPRKGSMKWVRGRR